MEFLISHFSFLIKKAYLCTLFGVSYNLGTQKSR